MVSPTNKRIILALVALAALVFCYHKIGNGNVKNAIKDLTETIKMPESDLATLKAAVKDAQKVAVQKESKLKAAKAKYQEVYEKYLNVLVNKPRRPERPESAEEREAKKLWYDEKKKAKKLCDKAYAAINEAYAELNDAVAELNDAKAALDAFHPLRFRI